MVQEKAMLNNITILCKVVKMMYYIMNIKDNTNTNYRGITTFFGFLDLVFNPNYNYIG